MSTKPLKPLKPLPARVAERLARAVEAVTARTLLAEGVIDKREILTAVAYVVRTAERIREAAAEAVPDPTARRHEDRGVPPLCPRCEARCRFVVRDGRRAVVCSNPDCDWDPEKDLRLLSAGGDGEGSDAD